MTSPYTYETFTNKNGVHFISKERGAAFIKAWIGSAEWKLIMPRAYTSTTNPLARCETLHYKIKGVVLGSCESVNLGHVLHITRQ